MSQPYDAEFVADHVLQSCSLDFKHVDNASVSARSEARFHIKLAQTLCRGSLADPERGFCNLELKRRWRLVHCKRPDIPPVELPEQRMCKCFVTAE